jgi:shikimate 5-dehydrogenase
MEQCLHRNFDAVVHATPVGMYPHTNECFFPSRIPGEIVFDMVYNPLETVLLRRAAAEGKTTIQGIQMFVEQAVHQFEAWSAASAPRAVMEKAALEALSTQFKQQHA